MTTANNENNQCNRCGKSVGNMRHEDLPNVRESNDCFKCLTDPMPFNFLNNAEFNTTLQNS